ncbi:MAG: ABC transporter permease subunit [Nitrososphaeraceae archaeon]
MIAKDQTFSLVMLGLCLITIVYLAYPFITVLIFVDPSAISDAIDRPEVINAFVLSAATATISTVILAIFGIPVGYVLARFHNLPGRSVLRIIVFAPLVLPPLASGALLLGAFGPLSPIMKMFPTLDFTQSVAGIIIAQFYVASPFMILASEMAFESFDESYELMSRVLGKTRFETFIQVSVPLAKTGIIIGFIMSWVRAVGELGATMMMAYNPHTISIQIFEDNAIGGLSRAIPDIFFSIILSVIALAAFYLYSARSKNRGLLRLY